MTHAKPREWWIEFEGDPKRDGCRGLRYVNGQKPGFVAPDEEAIHVVEYSALTEAVAMIDKLAEALRSSQNIAGQFSEYFQAIQNGEYANNGRPAPMRTFELILKDAADKNSEVVWPLLGIELAEFKTKMENL